MAPSKRSIQFSSESFDHGTKAIGKPGSKGRFDIVGFAGLVISFVCFSAACLTVSPGTSVPWKLGLKRQLQVVGLLLSVMNQCLLAVLPTFFLTVEARFGRSTLQNLSAILRNSSLLPQTHMAWRTTLLGFVILPIGLSLIYKEFQQGRSSIHGPSTIIDRDHPIFYGLTGPASLVRGSKGVSLMANATLPFALATQLDPPLPSFPVAYGFNTLILSDKSAAALDAPLSGFVASIQQRLLVDETIYLSAPVHGTVTTYNETIESHRDDEDFWKHYQSAMNVTDLSKEVRLSDLYNNVTLGLLISDLGRQDSSYSFPAFLPSNASNNFINFRHGAWLLDTRRASCFGQWRITYNSIELVDGSCNGPPLPKNSQNIFRYASLAMGQYFMPSITEYFSQFSIDRRQSPWLMPTLCSVIANMYWARVTTLNGYQTWRGNTSVFVDPDPTNIQRSEVYYPGAGDTVIWSRPTMNTSWVLYFVLALQPCLILLIFFEDILLYRVPVGRGFGLISILAGIRPADLTILKGASFSGNLHRPVRVRIAVQENEEPNPQYHGHVHRGDDDDNNNANDPNHPRIEYILDDHRKTGSLPSSSSPRRRKSRKHGASMAENAFGTSTRVMSPDVSRGSTRHQSRRGDFPFISRPVRGDAGGNYEMLSH